MKKISKTVVFLMITMLVLMVAGGSAFADSTKLNGEAHFNGKKITSTFDSQKVADAFKNLQPGDDITVTVKYQNDYSKSTDWYMANEIVKTLEKIDKASKNSQAENGGYTYSLVQTKKDKKKVVLFSNGKVGGEAKPANMEGLEQATNALDDWFYIETLGKGEFGLITLSISFEGETEVNDYMDTDGEVLMRFAVELTKSDKASSPDKPNYQQLHRVKTGDKRRIGLFLLMVIAGLIILTLLAIRKKDNKGGEA